MVGPMCSRVEQSANAIKWGLSLRALPVNNFTFSLSSLGLWLNTFSKEFLLLLFYFVFVCLFNFPLHNRISLSATNFSEKFDVSG